MEIKLTIEQYEYLTQDLLRNRESILSKLVYIENPPYYILVDEDTADEIRDLAMEDLQIKGFDANYDLTKAGVILEELIDVFFIDSI